MFTRWAAIPWSEAFDEPFVHIIFGARQTGKSTLGRHLLPAAAIQIDLSVPSERSRYEADPDRLIALCRSLPESKAGSWVFIDEAQYVPRLFDAVQHLYDSDKRRWRFILCGSSARKLRQTGANLLPGRSLVHRLFPLTLAERPASEAPPAFRAPTLPNLPWTGRKQRELFPTADLVTRLAYGDLPGVVTAKESLRGKILQSYALLHIEEEIRREALVKDLPAFVRFLRLAAAESGQMVNYHKISKDAGLSVPTIKNHYQLLEDMFLGFRLPAFSRSPRKNLLSTDRFLFFDLGIRHAAAGLHPSPDTAMANPGPLFEQWVGIELWRRLQYLERGSLHYFRTKDGAEVDYIIEAENHLFPIEVKWTENPTRSDTRHLLTFLEEHPKQAKHGYVICRCAQPLALAPQITALPWFAF